MNSGEKSARFYADLPTLPDFGEIGDKTIYHDAPDDWVVVVCDVIGSTQAVAEGKYKTVNMIGAACIVAVLNISNGTQIPYEFGGDGATLLIPPELQESAANALCSLRNVAQDVFGLGLRVGAVPIGAIRNQGTSVSVARYALGEDNVQALFAGGVGLADHLIKSDESYDLCAGLETIQPDLTGLSCRWEPLRTQGQMISLIVIGTAEDNDSRIMQAGQALEAIRSVTGPLSDCAPANENSLAFRFPPRGTLLEARTLDAGKLRPRRVFRILFEAFFQKVGHKFGLQFGDYNAPVYKEELKRHTDYRRYGDAIRLVLDCKTGTDQELRNALGKIEKDGKIIFGMHVADHALMTCLVFDLKTSSHVHFIDGGDGGLTLAAKEFKSKLKD